MSILGRAIANYRNQYEREGQSPLCLAFLKIVKDLGEIKSIRSDHQQKAVVACLDSLNYTILMENVISFDTYVWHCSDPGHDSAAQVALAFLTLYLDRSQEGKCIEILHRYNIKYTAELNDDMSKRVCKFIIDPWRGLERSEAKHPISCNCVLL